MKEYEVVSTEDVSKTDLSDVDALPPESDVRDIDAALGAEDVLVKLWYFEPGEEIQYHAHSEQEEIFYVLEGRFSLKLGRSGDTEVVEVSEGDWWRAAAMVGHGHRYLGDETGVVLAIGAPKVDDPGLDPHSLPEE